MVVNYFCFIKDVPDFSIALWCLMSSPSYLHLMQVLMLVHVSLFWMCSPATCRGLPLQDWTQRPLFWARCLPQQLRPRRQHRPYLWPLRPRFQVFLPVLLVGRWGQWPRGPYNLLSGPADHPGHHVMPMPPAIGPSQHLCPVSLCRQLLLFGPRQGQNRLSRVPFLAPLLPKTVRPQFVARAVSGPQATATISTLLCVRRDHW